MPKLDLAAIPSVARTGYPEPFRRDVEGRSRQGLSEAAGLEDFGVNIITLQPGAWASQRHWHEAEDEFALILEGEAVLIEDGGRTPMRAGDCAVWPKGIADGHHLINESDAPVRFLVVGARGSKGDALYPDIDLHYDGESRGFLHKDGRPQAWELR